jgi:hypothetical protein
VIEKFPAFGNHFMVFSDSASSTPATTGPLLRRISLGARLGLHGGRVKRNYPDSFDWIRVQSICG